MRKLNYCGLLFLFLVVLVTGCKKDEVQTPLSDAMELAHQSYFEVGGVTYNELEGYFILTIGFSWHIHEIPGSYTYIWHGGRTNGYMAYMAFNLEESTGLVLLCNQSTQNTIVQFGDDLVKALHKY